MPRQNDDDNFSREGAITQAVINMHVMEQRLKTLEETREDYVTKLEFWPVKMIAYGLASTALMGIMTAVLSLVVLKK